jgi:hypothetical protein
MTGEPDVMNLFNMALTDIANGPHQRPRLAVDLLRRLHSNGLSLEQCADAKVMNRSVDTLKKYARELGLSFSDYVPLELRPKKDKPAKKPKGPKVVHNG